MQVFDLKSKPMRFSSECLLGIKVHACDPNMPHLLAVTLMNLLMSLRMTCQGGSGCYVSFQLCDNAVEPLLTNASLHHSTTATFLA